MIFHALLIKFYTLSTEKLICLLLICLSIFSFCKIKFDECRGWKVLMTIGVAGFTYLILQMTVFWRGHTNIDILNLVPFHSYCQYFTGQNTEALRTCIMNMLLFAPMGLFAGELFPKSFPFWKKALLIVIPCCLLSVSVEYLQFLRQCGEVEVDDVINNTFGAFAGGMCMPMVFRVRIVVKEKISRIG